MLNEFLTLLQTATVLALMGVILYLVYLSTFKKKVDEEARPLHAKLYFVLTWPIRMPFRILVAMLGLSARSRYGTFLRRKLDEAGLYDVDEEDMAASQFAAGVLLYVMPVIFLPQLWASLLLLILIGWVYPIYMLDSLSQMRKQQMFAELPYVLDLLSLGIEAGLDFKMSIERLVNFSDPSPLINELKGLLNDLNFGTPMEEALVRLRRRIDILAFFTFVEAMIQATQMGIDVSSTLRAQAEQMRVAYFQNVEKAANKLPILVLFPTAFCIFPPILIITLGPIVIQIVERLPH